MTNRLFLSDSDQRPMYQQIIDQIAARVMAGDWEPGQALPSIRELAADSGVSVITVKRAYEELGRFGLIVTRPGKGSVVADQPDRARELLDAELNLALKTVADQGAKLGLARQTLHERLDAVLDDVDFPSNSTKGS